jgi:uncharacterized protein YbjT (DUF2867 family)
MSIDEKPILVIGATGRHGGTGAVVAQSLHERGIPVRIMARELDARIARYEAMGVQVTVGDLQDRRSLMAPLANVETAYFTYPISLGIVEAAANFASAAQSTGLKRVVAMSMAPAHPDSRSDLGRAQWLAEEVLGWAGFSCICLRVAALFFEDLRLLHRAEIFDDGLIRNSFQDVPLHWMSGTDAGRLAVAALLRPDRFPEGASVYPTGKLTYSFGQVAALLSRHLHRYVRHETISEDLWRRRLMDLRTRNPAINSAMSQHISAVGASLLRPIPPNDIFERTVGEDQMDLSEALARGLLN